MIIKDIYSYLEIDNVHQIHSLLEFKKKYSYLEKYAGKKVLFIDKDPNYNNFNISQLIFLFSHIFKIDLYYYYFKESYVDKKIHELIHGQSKLVDGTHSSKKEKPPVDFNSRTILSKIFGDFKLKTIGEFSLKDDIQFDLVICNGRGFINDYDEILGKVKFKKIFYFFKSDAGGIFLEYGDLLYKKEFLKYFRSIVKYDLHYIAKTFPSYDVFQDGGYIFFPKLFSELYSFSSNEKKYDIVIAGSYRARDFALVKTLINRIKGLKLLIVTETSEDVKNIKQELGDFTGDIVINTFSYSKMYKLVSLGKIYLNCSKYGSFSNGITGMLVPCSTNSLIVSFRNPFFRKIIRHGENGFLYSNIDELEGVIKKVLSFDVEKYNQICKTLYSDFNSQYRVEDILVNKVFSLL